MGRRLLAAMVMVLGSGVASTAFAQDPGKVGLTMGYPPGVGLVIHLSDAVAIRPEVTFTTSSIESEIDTGVQVAETLSTDTWTVGVGIGALFYLGSRDNLRTYISPRFQYSWLSSDIDSPNAIGRLDTESSGDAFSVGASFGAQYSLNSRFSVFGELGASYSDSEITQTTDTSLVTIPPFPPIQRTTSLTTRSSGFGIRTGAGVVLYF